MKVAVFCDEHTLHEAHVGLKCQWAGEPRSGAGATDAIQSNEPLEIGNLRGFVEGFKRRGGRLRRKRR
jgi:hypothetical protein